MDDVQKMALVPYDMLQTTLGENRDSARLSGLLRPPPLDKVLNLDRRMTATLNDSGMTEDDKAIQYSQLCVNYNILKRKDRSAKRYRYESWEMRPIATHPGVCWKAKF